MDGILLLNKPPRWTSHDAVDFLRRRLGEKKVGHAGTLDPMATGLLVMLVGRGTKSSEALMGLDKNYRGSIRLGTETDSWDLDGKVLSEKPVQATLADVQAAAASLTGKVKIIPPSFSAIKKDGEKYYELARKGVMLEPPSRDVTIYEFRIERFEGVEVSFFVSCTKGTYVRSLAHHMGEKLGCGASLSSLIRTRIGPYHLEKALTIDELTMMSPPEIARRLIAVP